MPSFRRSVLLAALLGDLGVHLGHVEALDGVDDLVEREDRDLLEIYANVFVERDSQKGIIIGKGGARLREVGERARREIEALLGRKVYLALHVKVAKDWQRDPKQLGKLGF